MKKLHIKAGSIELSLETEDLATDAPVALDLILKISSRTANTADQNRSSQGEPKTPAPTAGEPEGDFNQHMNTYVAKLGADSCRKILQAAAYNLTLADQKDSFSKDELFAKAREAREWKADYSNQQAVNVGRMVKASELIEKSGGVYCVPNKELEAAKQALSA